MLDSKLFWERPVDVCLGIWRFDGELKSQHPDWWLTNWPADQLTDWLTEYWLFQVKLWSVNSARSIATIHTSVNVCCCQFSPTSKYDLVVGTAGWQTCRMWTEIYRKTIINASQIFCRYFMQFVYLFTEQNFIIDSDRNQFALPLPLPLICRPLRPSLRCEEPVWASHRVQRTPQGRLLCQVHFAYTSRHSVSRLINLFSD